MGAGVGLGVGLVDGVGVGLGEGAGVDEGVGVGVGLGVGVGVGVGVGDGVGVGVGEAVGEGDGLCLRADALSISRPLEPPAIRLAKNSIAPNCILKLTIVLLDLLALALSSEARRRGPFASCESYEEERSIIAATIKRTSRSRRSTVAPRSWHREPVPVVFNSVGRDVM